jgi:hypothetical protein
MFLDQLQGSGYPAHDQWIWRFSVLPAARACGYRDARCRSNSRLFLTARQVGVTVRPRRCCESVEKSKTREGLGGPHNRSARRKAEPPYGIGGPRLAQDFVSVAIPAVRWSRHGFDRLLCFLRKAELCRTTDASSALCGCGCAEELVLIQQKDYNLSDLPICRPSDCPGKVLVC